MYLFHFVLKKKKFEENVRDKWSTVKDAAVNLKNLENHHLTSLTDVR